jgi:phenylalanyl-tRNA synthetase beta chain
VRVPVSWLTEQLETKEKFTAEQIAEAFVRVGLEVEEVAPLGPVTGPVVVGRVAEIEELTGFKKPIRYCMVEVA